MQVKTLTAAFILTQSLHVHSVEYDNKWQKRHTLDAEINVLVSLWLCQEPLHKPHHISVTTSMFTHHCCTQNTCCWHILRLTLVKKLRCKWFCEQRTLRFNTLSLFSYLITFCSCSLQSSSPQQHSSSTGDPYRHLSTSLQLHGWPCSSFISSVSSMCYCALDSKSRHSREGCSRSKAAHLHSSTKLRA